MTSLLIVDDSREMRKLIKNIVSKVSDEVFECSDGAEALLTYIEHHPDWVLMDVEMKEKDGLQATKEIMREFPDAKVIVITKHADAQTREAAKEAGAKGFLSKDNLVELRSMLKKSSIGVNE